MAFPNTFNVFEDLISTISIGNSAQNIKVYIYEQVHIYIYIRTYQIYIIRNILYKHTCFRLHKYIHLAFEGGF